MSKKMTLTEKLKEAESRADVAEFDLKIVRGQRQKMYEDSTKFIAKLANERIRARTQYMLGQQSTLGMNAAHQALRQVAVYQTAIRNLFKLAQNPILVCPNCGHVWMAGPKDDVRTSGYRLCETCLATVPDPWSDKPSEYALAK